MPTGIRLLPVPNFLKELTIKADLNGITILKEGRFKKRYTGSKKYEVDINGNLHRTAELKKLTKQPEVRKKKRPPNPGSLAEITEPTEGNKDSGNNVDKPARSYTINKPEIRSRIFAMINSQRQKELYFWTVTFPLKTADAVIYKLFNTWLTTLRQKKWLREYLWVAERQQNGTLHFHIAIPHKMSVVAANRAMAQILANASKRKEINYSVYQCKRYNGVDIAKNRKEKKVTNFALGKRGKRALTTYLTKYITKNDGEFFHLAWHNSRGFSCLFTAVTFTVDEFTQVYAFVSFVRRNSAVSNEWFMFFPRRTIGSVSHCLNMRKKDPGFPYFEAMRYRGNPSRYSYRPRFIHKLIGSRVKLFTHPQQATTNRLNSFTEKASCTLPFLFACVSTFCRLKKFS